MACGEHVRHDGEHVRHDGEHVWHDSGCYVWIGKLTQVCYG